MSITAMLIAAERKSGLPSELTDLKWISALRLGLGTVPPSQLPSTGEQALIQGGPLALSALAGAAYAAGTSDTARAIPSGVAFGLLFYAAAHWIIGTALGVKQPEWRAAKESLGMHTANHILFGLITAAAAKTASRT
jgi:hypothetical protein